MMSDYLNAAGDRARRLENAAALVVTVFVAIGWLATVGIVVAAAVGVVLGYAGKL